MSSTDDRRIARFALLVAAHLALVAAPAAAHDEAGGCEHCAHARSAVGGPPAPRERYLRSTREYTPPDVVLVDQDGRSVRLAEVLAPGTPLAVNFVFTTCGTICPVMSATFSGLRQRVGSRDLRMVSISIDPEHDRPAALRAYAARFGADPGWRFYTGTVDDVRRVLTAFEAYAGDKANHRPITLLRPASGRAWVRIDGLASSEDLAKELRELRAER